MKSPEQNRSESHNAATEDERVFDLSPSGATETCRYCGTMYDTHINVGYVPPYGDGCEKCSPTEGLFDDDE
jgi:hypothetical protein